MFLSSVLFCRLYSLFGGSGSRGGRQPRDPFESMLQPFGSFLLVLSTE